ncbi:MAG: hypothetical protein K2H52_14035 [Lachnospiraceae bacterium]|nr:hypothetical protein [Lachnospiraceae bacterium]MDE6184616.1 hypothetical protein [Lachnospiraceae bacterium]MDE7285525.1 hypothetical protein [Lachnospiraceae bacterium]
MTKLELLQKAKPILFNTDMVRAILDNRKTATRRVVKREKVDAVLSSEARKGNPDISDENFIKCLIDAPCLKGDILYVRESGIIQSMKNFDKSVKIYFPVDGSLVEFKVTPDEYERLSKFPENKKISPYWLTKQESRIFLKVTDVRIERLQDITIDGIRAEGLASMAVHAGDMEIALAEWRILWNSTIKKSDRDRYGWNANPWVWVIEFERIYPDD